MYHGFSFAYAPSFLPGLTLFGNRVCLVPWRWENLKYIVPSKESGNIEREDDQKGSLGADWIFPQVGLEIYGELGIDDFVPGKIKGYIRYPFHTMVYAVGLKKSLNLSPGKKIHGEIIFEWNNMEASQDFQFQWPYSFYFHGATGYTQNGQLIGAGSGWGGNSQFLEFRFFYPKGVSSVFAHRSNPDNNFIYSQSIYTSAGDNDRETEKKYFTGFKSDFTFGLSTLYFLTENLSIGGGAVYTYITNPYYFYADPEGTELKYLSDLYEHNFSFNMILKCIF
jgi:hypothetical protein